MARNLPIFLLLFLAACAMGGNGVTMDRAPLYVGSNGMNYLFDLKENVIVDIDSDYLIPLELSTFRGAQYVTFDGYVLCVDAMDDTHKDITVKKEGVGVVTLGDGTKLQADVLVASMRGKTLKAFISKEGGIAAFSLVGSEGNEVRFVAVNKIRMLRLEKELRQGH